MTTQQQLADTLAAYGYRLSRDNEIASARGIPTGAFVWHSTRNRLQVRNGSKDLLWSGADISNFLERFWFAKRVG